MAAQCNETIVCQSNDSIAARKLVCVALTVHEHDLLAELDGRAQLELMRTKARAEVI